jgi:hypothetical protein
VWGSARDLEVDDVEAIRRLKARNFHMLREAVRPPGSRKITLVSRSWQGSARRHSMRMILCAGARLALG